PCEGGEPRPARCVVDGGQRFRPALTGDCNSAAPGGQAHGPDSLALGLGGRAPPRPPPQPPQGALPCPQFVLAAPRGTLGQADHLAAFGGSAGPVAHSFPLEVGASGNG